MMSFDRHAASFEGFRPDGDNSRQAPQAGPEILKALDRYYATKSRLDDVHTAANLWSRGDNPRWQSDPADATRLFDWLERRVQKAAQPYADARRKLFGMILKKNEHDREADTFPPCGVTLGGRLAWLTLDDPTDGLINAKLTVN